MYVLKSGNLYLTSSGTWSGRQRDALRVIDPPASPDATVRAVKLKLRTDRNFEGSTEPDPRD